MVTRDWAGCQIPSRAVVVALVLLAAPAFAAQPAAPTVTDLELTGTEDTQLLGQIVASDPQGGNLTYKLKNTPRHGVATIQLTTGAFAYMPAKDYFGEDRLSFEVSNGRRKAVGAIKLNLTAVNDGPVAAALSLKTAEDSAVRGAILATDTDRDVLTYRLGAQPGHGDAQVDARTGAVTYQPSPDYHGIDAFTVEVSDGQATSASEVNVVVASVNDGPVAASAQLELSEDTQLEGKPNVSDVDGDPLTFRIAKMPKHGELTASAQTGAFSYRPKKDFHGEDAFSLEVTDGKRKATSAILLQIAAVNDAPVTRPVSLISTEDTLVTGAVHASDVDGDALTFTITSAAAHGAARVDAKTGRFSYTPAANYHGVDAFTIGVTDGALSVNAEVQLVISAVNDAPAVLATLFALDEDNRFEGQLTASDVDGDSLVFKAASKPAHGVFELNAQTGAFTFLPARDYHGSESFLLDVSDGKMKSQATITLKVASINDAPTAKPVALSTSEDTAAKGVVIATDVDDGALTYSVSAPASSGRASVDSRTGVVTFVPAADFHGTDAFTVEVSDGSLSVTSAVTVAITPVPDPPKVHSATLATSEDLPADGKLPGSDADGDRLTFNLLSQPRLGSATLLDQTTGEWRFVPSANLYGSDEVSFAVTDGTTTVRGVVKIEVAPVNDLPTLANLSLVTLEDQSVEGQLVGDDLDGDQLSYSIATAPTDGRSIILSASKGGVRFEPALDHHGSVSFTVTVSDGKATSAPASVAIRIEPQNDAPVASAAKLRTDEDTALVGAMRATDVDGEGALFAIVRAPKHGTVSVTDAASGLFVYSPAPNYFGEDVFDFSATDAAQSFSVASIRIAVAPVDDVPIAAASGITAPFRGTVTGRLHGYDRESKSVTYRIVDQPSNGRVKLLDEKTGDFEFSTDGSTSSSRSFRFEVSDGALKSAPAELVVQIRSL